MTPALALPLVASLVYVAGALFVKRAADLGASGGRTALVSNFVTALLFQALLPLGGTFHAELLWQPALVGVLFAFGQVANYAALARGHVSVATPVLGSKILLVAFFTSALLPDPVSPTLWGAAAVSSVAVALLGRTGAAPHHHVGHTVLLAGCSAAAFALADVFVQKWSPAWGVGRFLPATLGCVALLSAAALPLVGAPLRAVPHAARPWLFAGCACVGLQSLLFASAIASFGGATAANVVYGSRGLWSVVVVWTFGHWFASREQQLGAAVLGWRLAGAALMMGAIAMVVLG